MNTATSIILYRASSDRACLLKVFGTSYCDHFRKEAAGLDAASVANPICLIRANCHDTLQSGVTINEGSNDHSMLEDVQLHYERHSTSNTKVINTIDCFHR